MMENNSTPSPDPVPEASPIAVPVPAESAVTPPPAPPVIPLRERPNAPLLHKGFQNLFRLGIANIVINLLNNTFKLGDKIPSLGVVLSAMSFAVSILTLIVLWKLSAAVPRFRKRRVPQPFAADSCFPLPRLSVRSKLAGADRRHRMSTAPARRFGDSAGTAASSLPRSAAYHQLTACAEAFDGADDEMAAKWRSSSAPGRS